jgi:hypothetical protein
MPNNNTAKYTSKRRKKGSSLALKIFAALMILALVLFYTRFIFS